MLVYLKENPELIESLPPTELYWLAYLLSFTSEFTSEVFLSSWLSNWLVLADWKNSVIAN